MQPPAVADTPDARRVLHVSLGRAQNPRLVYLNISHNHINSLEGLTLAPSLRVLNAGHNRIVSLAALRGCAQLEELWLHRNNIVSLREVEHLAVGHCVLVDSLCRCLCLTAWFCGRCRTWTTCAR